MSETYTVEPTIRYYTTDGSVRGECGHRHRTAEAAEACARRDQIGCASVGGYSDRYVYAVMSDGSRDREWTGSDE